MEMKNKGAAKARKDIEQMGLEYAENLMNLMAKCSGIDKDFRHGYETVVIIERNAK